MTFLRVLGIIVGGLLALVGGGCTLFLFRDLKAIQQAPGFLLIGLIVFVIGVALVFGSLRRR